MNVFDEEFGESFTNTLLKNNLEIQKPKKKVLVSNNSKSLPFVKILVNLDGARISGARR